MSTLPWILLGLSFVFLIYVFLVLDDLVRWARRAILHNNFDNRPAGWLVSWFGFNDLYHAIEGKSLTEGEISLAASKRIETLLSPLTDAVLVVDAKDLLRLANPAAKELFNIREDELGASFIPLVKSAEFIDLVRRVRKEGGASSTILLHRSPLADAWVQASGAQTDPEAFGEGAVIFVLTEVTALKRLQSMEREFVTNVSHDLRTPVTILRGYAETLADDFEILSPEDRTRFIKKIVGSVGRLQSLVEGLLALASLESSTDAMNYTPGAIHRACHEVAEEFAARCRAAHVELKLDLGDNNGGVADPVQARRLIQNLIDNALSHAAGATQIVLRTFESDGGFTLEVEDDGSGVSPSDITRIFDRFFRTDKSRRAGGSGLGLSIVRQVAELHGGTVGASNVNPRGLKITVTIPSSN
jgi:signal transduction histidine kinase